MSQQYKLDIFKLLNNISNKKYEYYKQLSEDEVKAFQPLVVMRWLTGTKDPAQVYFINELVNPLVFNLDKHKHLLYNMMAISSTGGTSRYQWKKAKSKKSTKSPTVTKVVQDYYNYSSSDAADVLPLLSDEDILSFAQELGRQPDDIKLIKKELKLR